MKSKNKMTKAERKEGLEKMLGLAEGKLARAIEQNKEWDINHYRGDVSLVKKQLAEL